MVSCGLCNKEPKWHLHYATWAISCAEKDKGIFEYHKAVNICNSLPKTLKKFNFYVEEIDDAHEEVKQEVVLGEEYSIPDDVSRWIEKLSVCGDIVQELKKRKEELNTMMSNVDKEITNILHKIELEKSKDMYGGWLAYKELQTAMKKRRNVKDEMLIVNEVLRMSFARFSVENLERSIMGLANRKFSLRVTDV